MSKRVEGQLYEIKESLESYIDLSTLDSRLQALALAKQQLEQQAQQRQEKGGGGQGNEIHDANIMRDQYRPEHHHERTTPQPAASASSSTLPPLYPTATTLVPMTRIIPGDDHSANERSTSTSTTTRTEHLVQVLGGGIGRYRQIQTLLQEIREEQENLEQAMLLQNPTTHHDGHSSPDAATTSPIGSRKRKRMIMNMTVKEDQTPDPIKDLYLETQELQNAFEKVPMELLGTIDWTLLIARTQTILRTFREWNGDIV